MTLIQRKAFDAAKQSLDPSSKFFRDDLASLKSHYAKMPDSRCSESLARFESISTVTEDEIARNCQLDGLL